MRFHLGVQRIVLGFALPGFLLPTAVAGCTLGIEDGERLEGDDISESRAALTETCAEASTFTFETSGAATTAYLDARPVASFTAGAYTVHMEGPSRSFTWGAPAVVTVITTSWVRTLPLPFDPATPASTLTNWLNAARAKNCDAPTGAKDIIGIAFDYAEGTALDARHEWGADFHDFLGTSWDPSDASARNADPTQLGKLDCSGYVRLVWGARANFSYEGAEAMIPLSLNEYAGAIPRTSRQQYSVGPGKVIVPFRLQPTDGLAANGGTPTAAELSALQVGDVVFFDLNCDYSLADPACSADPSTAVTHVGLYLGADSAAHLRFISSRLSADGPTMGNLGGWSILDLTRKSTYFPKRFRAARRF